MHEHTQTEHGFIQVLIAALAVIGIVVVVIIALVVGLDNLYQKESDESLFAKDSKLNQMRAKLKDTKDEITAEIANEMQSETPRVERREELTADQRLDEINKRLKAETK